MVKNSRLGTAHNGLSDWFYQRFSAVIVALCMPVAFAMLLAVFNGSLNQMQLLDVLDSHPGRILHALFLFALLTHAFLGIKVIVEDYVHVAALRIVLMGGLLFAVAALGIWWFSIIWAWGS